jgi:hypothetical protein
LHSLPGAYCLESENAQERRPARIADALGEVVALEPVGRLHVLMRDGVVGAHERERRLVMKVGALPPHFLMRLG